MVLHPAGKEFVATVLGCWYAGMIAVPSPTPGRFTRGHRRATAIAATARVSCVVTVSSAEGPISNWLKQSGMELPMLVGKADDCLPVEGEEVHLPLGSDIAVLQYTSGSTSGPKGVVVTHDNLTANAQQLLDAFDLHDQPKFGGWIPNYHDMGLMAHITPPLLAAGSTILMSPTAFMRRPASWLELIDRQGLVFSAAPDFAYELCCSRISDEDISKIDLTRWRFAASGSEPVNPKVVREFSRKFAPAGFSIDKMTPAYGLAESTVFVSAAARHAPDIRSCDAESLAQNRVRPARDGSPAREIVSCGPPSGTDARIVDPETRTPVTDGEIGEIWLRGPSVAQGYWGDPTATLATFDNSLNGKSGYLRTGDLGALLEGELYVTGRIKEVVIIGGRNLYPQDIEHELRLHHTELRERSGAVFGATVAGGEREAVVVCHEVRGRLDGRQLSGLASGIRQTVSREFGVVPGAIVLLRRGEIPKTTSGKIQRSRMRQLFQDGELRPVFADGYRVREPITSAGDPFIAR